AAIARHLNPLYGMATQHPNPPTPPGGRAAPAAAWWGWPAEVGGSRRWSGAGPRGGRRGPGRTPSPSTGTRSALPLPPPRDKRAFGPAALEQQLVVHGQLADLGAQPGDLIVATVSRPALEGGLAGGQEVVTPAGEGGGGDAQLTREQ